MHKLKIAAIGLSAVLVVLMICGSISQHAGIPIYHSPLFALLWAILLLDIFVIVWHQRKRIPMWGWMACAAFLLIFTGAMLTHFTGQFGTMELFPNQTADNFNNQQGQRQQLPFTVFLQDFQIVYYEHTTSPMDYIARIRIDHKTTLLPIAMNNVARYQGYRFYLSDHKSNGMVKLLISHDPWGTMLVYLGFVCLLLAFLMMFMDKESCFRRLIKSKTMKVLCIGFASLAGLSSAYAETEVSLPRTLPAPTAAEMGNLCIQYHGRVCPLQTFARDFTYQLCGSTSYRGLTAEQVLSGWLFYFEDWQHEPIFKIKGKEVQAVLSIDGKYAALSDFYDEYGEYRLEKVIAALPLDDSRRTRFVEADFKYLQTVALCNGTLLRIYPLQGENGQIDWYSPADDLPANGLAAGEMLFIRKNLLYARLLAQQEDFSMLDTLWKKQQWYQCQRAGEALPAVWRLQLERFYNRCSPGWKAAGIVLLCAFLFVLFTWYEMGFDKKVKFSWVPKLNRWILELLTCYFAFLFVVRWILSGYVPLANGYETMMFLAMCLSLFSILLHRRVPLLLPNGLLAVAFVMMAAMLEGAHTPVTHVMPILKSPLLLIHVALMMVAYALLMMTFLQACTALLARCILRERKPWSVQLQYLSLGMLYPALFCLSAGIIVGSVWANISWGSYWSWDPKEVWALITAMVYAVPLSVNWKKYSPTYLQVYLCVAFLSVVMTYFGVNCLLGGMHSYA